MTPDHGVNALGPADDPAGPDRGLAASLRELQSLGAGPAPTPSPALAAFLADPTGGATPAAGWTWMLKEKLAHLSRAGKVVVIASGIALAGTVSAAAAWQVTSVFPTDTVETPAVVTPHNGTPPHVKPSAPAADGADAKDSGKGHQDDPATTGKGHSDKGKGNSEEAQSGHGQGSGHNGKGNSDEAKSSDKGGSNKSDGSSEGKGSGNGSGDGSDAGDSSGDGSGDEPSADSAPADEPTAETPPGDSPDEGSPAAEG